MNNQTKNKLRYKLQIMDSSIVRGYPKDEAWIERQRNSLEFYKVYPRQKAVSNEIAATGLFFYILERRHRALYTDPRVIVLNAHASNKAFSNHILRRYYETLHKTVN